MLTELAPKRRRSRATARSRFVGEEAGLVVGHAPVHALPVDGGDGGGHGVDQGFAAGGETTTRSRVGASLAVGMGEEGLPASAALMRRGGCFPERKAWWAWTRQESPDVEGIWLAGVRVSRGGWLDAFRAVRAGRAAGAQCTEVNL
jgi:hypothetical protein